MPSAQPLSSFAVPASGTSGAAAPSSGVRTWIVMGDLHDKAARLGEIQGLEEDPRVYTWGFEDGRGNPIQMTISQYVDRYVFNQDYTQASEIGIDKIMISGNALENITTAYPGCRFVDFCIPSIDPVNEGLDWCSLKLVFELGESGWLLVGVVHGEWTI